MGRSQRLLADIAPDGRYIACEVCHAPEDDRFGEHLFALSGEDDVPAFFLVRVRIGRAGDVLELAERYGASRVLRGMDAVRTAPHGDRFQPVARPPEEPEIAFRVLCNGRGRVNGPRAPGALEEAGGGPVPRAAGDSVGSRAEFEAPDVAAQVPDVGRVDKPVQVGIDHGGRGRHGVVHGGVVGPRVAPQHVPGGQIDHEEALAALVAVGGAADRQLVSSPEKTDPLLVAVDLHPVDHDLAPGIPQVGGAGVRGRDPPLEGGGQGVRDVQGPVAAVVDMAA